VNLTWRDIDWHEGIINVVGKGGKPAKVPLSNLLRALLWPLPRTSETVFGVTYSGVKSAWRRCRKKSGIVNLKFHDLRHTCATRSLRNGMDIRLVKKLLRHEDISTTMRYAHVTMDDLRTAMDATSPTQITTGRKNKSSK
jgi:integrase